MGCGTKWNTRIKKISSGIIDSNELMWLQNGYSNIIKDKIF